MKPKTPPSRRLLTEAEMRKREKAAEAKALEMLKQMKLDATADATVTCKAIIYRSLILAYGFTSDDILNLVAIEDDLSDSIASGEYTYDELIDALADDGIDFKSYYEEK